MRREEEGRGIKREEGGTLQHGRRDNEKEGGTSTCSSSIISFSLSLESRPEEFVCRTGSYFGGRVRRAQWRKLVLLPIRRAQCSGANKGRVRRAQWRKLVLLAIRRAQWRK